MTVIRSMHKFQTGNKTYYEILGLEFVKKINKFDLDSKSRILEYLTRADVEASSILRTTHAIVSSTVEALLLQQQQSGGGDLLTGEGAGSIELPPGLFSGDQERFVRSAIDDISTFE
jgi:hypothetical protein